MFMTPREATLKAENDRLKAENEYLRQAVYSRDRITPIAMVAERELVVDAHSYTLPAACSIEGSLSRHGRYHVVGTLRFAAAEDLKVTYYGDANVIKSNYDYCINELFPYMHERFIRELAKKLKD